MAEEHVAEVLPDYALGTMPVEERARVERHLAWCAACRAEAGELSEGVEAMASLIPPADPPSGLEGRVVAAVSAASGRRPAPRRAVVAAVVAAFLAVAAVGWGVAMAGKADRLETEAAGARADANRAAREFADLLRDLVPPGAGSPVSSVVLESQTAAGGGGRAILFVSDEAGAKDFVLVVVGGLPEEVGPYRARITLSGGTVRIGRLWPSADRQLAAYRLFPAETSGYEALEVVAASGEVVLRGTFAATP